jgi:ribosomal protein S18 acetylase RimI-like enzyme
MKPRSWLRISWLPPCPGGAEKIQGYRYYIVLTSEPLTDDNLTGVFEFVRGCNPFAQPTWGWDTGRFVDWRWGSNTEHEQKRPGWFATHGRVFLVEGTIRAVRIAESGVRDVCIITARPDPELVATVLADLIAERTKGDVGMNLDVLDTPQWLETVLLESGLTPQRDTGHEWEYDLARTDMVFTLPQGFEMEDLTTGPDDAYHGIASCIAAAFGADYDIVAGLRSLEDNPLYRPELSCYVRAPGGRIAAYCRGTVDPTNGVGGIDPVCTHPDFQRLGLGKAVVRACFSTQRELGGRFIYIGSAAEPAAGTRLYRALGPSRRSDYVSWSRPSTHPEP